MSTTSYDEPSRRPPVLETTTTTVSGGQHIHRRISWAAIIGGVVLVVTAQLLWSLLGAGIGLDTVNANAGTTPTAGSLGISAGVWWIISSVVALAFGGFAAGWMAGIETRWDGVLHGLITWGIATLLTVYLLSSAIGGIVGGGASALGGLASAAGGGIKDAAQPVVQASGLSPDVLAQQAQAYLKPADPDPATMTPQDAQKEVATNLVSYAKGGPDAPAAKERVVSVMAAQQHVSHDQAAQQFDAAQAKLQQQKAQAVQVAKNAADASAAAASKTSFAAFADLLIGAIAAAVGGSLGLQRRRQVSQQVVR